MLAGELGYVITWKEGSMKVEHPKKGALKIVMRNGCPQIPKKKALQLIQELEEGKRMKKIQEEERSAEERWLRQLVKAHPVLRELPQHIQQKLVVSPAEDLSSILGCNRRKRKKMKEEGFVAHLYAGESEGYSLARAFKEVGGDPNLLVEIDIKRESEERHGRSHDMLRDHDGPCPSLLRAALDGELKALVMGPNCQTRSVLRHYPLPVPGGGPRPVRSWEEPWGKSTNTAEEQKKVVEDDVLLWRGLMLYIVQEEIRRAVGKGEESKMKLALEQPADPSHYVPEVVSFWGTKEWRKLQNMYQLQEQTFRQSSVGGRKVKPTTFGGDLRLCVPQLHQMKRFKRRK